MSELLQIKNLLKISPFQTFKKGPEALAYFYVKCGHVAPSSLEIEKVEKRLEMSRQLRHGIRSGNSSADIG